MRIIEVRTWKAILPDGSEVDDGNINALSVILSSKSESIPRGLDYFRKFNRLARAFEEAEKTKVIRLEEGDWLFIKNLIEREIPATWGMNDNIAKAIDEFINAKSE